MSAHELELRGIVRQIDRRWSLRRVQPLQSRASVLHIAAGGREDKRLILLTHSQADRLRNPHIARDEFHLLKTLNATDLPVADALYLSEASQPPFLITAFAEGSSRFQPRSLPIFVAGWPQFSMTFIG